MRKSRKWIIFYISERCSFACNILWMVFIVSYLSFHKRRSANENFCNTQSQCRNFYSRIKIYRSISVTARRDRDSRRRRKSETREEKGRKILLGLEREPTRRSWFRRRRLDPGTWWYEIVGDPKGSGCLLIRNPRISASFSMRIKSITDLARGGCGRAILPPSRDLHSYPSHSLCSQDYHLLSWTT